MGEPAAPPAPAAAPPPTGEPQNTPPQATDAPQAPPASSGLEKFTDPATGQVDLGKLGQGYLELQRQFHTTPPAQRSTMAIAPAEEGVPEDAGFSTIMAKANLNAADIHQEWTAHGKLTQGMYDALKKASGMSKGVINEIVADKVTQHEATVQRLTAKAHELAGGEQQWGTLEAWARTNLTASELRAYNALVESPLTAEVGFEWLVSRYARVNGEKSGGRLPVGGTPPAGGAGFNSPMDMLNAKRDKRYMRDKAYTAEVDAKVARMTPMALQGGAK